MKQVTTHFRPLFSITENKTVPFFNLLGIFLLFALYTCSAFSALPIGYQADFNGCSSVEDSSERQLCCDSVQRDCDTVCDNNLGDDSVSPGGYVICGLECEIANDSCKGGEKVRTGAKRPEHMKVPTPGLLNDGRKKDFRRKSVEKSKLKLKLKSRSN